MTKRVFQQRLEYLNKKENQPSNTGEDGTCYLLELKFLNKQVEAIAAKLEYYP